MVKTVSRNADMKSQSHPSQKTSMKSNAPKQSGVPKDLSGNKPTSRGSNGGTGPAVGTVK